jgi:hypothetical protein
MERGVGGRIEDAFASAKERGEAAFVTFVTAGYPTAKGTSIRCLSAIRFRVGLLQRLRVSHFSLVATRETLLSFLVPTAG